MLTLTKLLKVWAEVEIWRSTILPSLESILASSSKIKPHRNLVLVKSENIGIDHQSKQLSNLK
jgi:hypothetical protein